MSRGAEDHPSRHQAAEPLDRQLSAPEVSRLWPRKSLPGAGAQIHARGGHGLVPSARDPAGLRRLTDEWTD